MGDGLPGQAPQGHCDSCGNNGLLSRLLLVVYEDNSAKNRLFWCGDIRILRDLMGTKLNAPLHLRGAFNP